MRLTASAKYDDFEGSAAADVSDNLPVQKYLADRGLIGAEETVVAVRFWSGENFAGHAGPPSVQAFVMNKQAATSIGMGAINARAVNLEVTNDEFFGLFKRIEIVLTKAHLEIAGREIVEQ